MELQTLNNGVSDDIDSTCSTPYVSAPSSPGRPPHPSYFFSAPASPMHYILTSFPVPPTPSSDLTSSGSFEFDFSTNFSAAPADELFHNGQIRPMKLSSHLQRPQSLAPLLDVTAEEEEDDTTTVVEAVRGREMRMRSRSLQRRVRSVSPVRNSRSIWEEDNLEIHNHDKHIDTLHISDLELELALDPEVAELETPQPPESGTSSRSSSSGRNSKRWVFLKDLLYRSKSEGRGSTSSTKEKFWHSFNKPKVPSSAAAADGEKPKQKQKQKQKNPATETGKPSNGVGKKKPVPSAHERLYTANRAATEEMRRRTFLPYRQGLLGSLGCLGFNSRSYGAVNGFARSLNTVTSR